MKKAIYSIIASATLSGCFNFELPQVRISPEEPTIEDSLECYVDNFGMQYDYYWYRNEDIFKKTLDSERSYVSDLEMFAGDEWECKVFLPENEITNSIYIGADKVEILKE